MCTPRTEARKHNDACRPFEGNALPLLPVRAEDASAIRASDVDEVGAAVYLLHVYNEASFGHALRDDFLLVHHHAAALGVSVDDLQIVVHTQHARKSTFRNVTMTESVLFKYRSWLSPELMSMGQLVERSSSRFILFRTLFAAIARPLVAGSDSGERCSSAAVQAMRDRAYALANLTHTPAGSQQPPSVLFIDKSPREKRRVLNVRQVAAELQHLFPGSRVSVDTMRYTKPEEQLRTLSETAVLVANIGSASFRLLFLPDDAHVVLVGSVQRAQSTRRARGACHSEACVFRELDACWARLRHLTVHRYHVAPEDAVKPDGPVQWPVVDRNLHVRIRMDRLLDSMPAFLLKR